MTPEQIERLGLLADKAANCEAFADMRKTGAPLPMIVDGMVSITGDLKTELRALYVEIAGNDPWEGDAK